MEGQGARLAGWPLPRSLAWGLTWTHIRGHDGWPQAGVDLEGWLCTATTTPGHRGIEAGSRKGRARARGPGMPQRPAESCRAAGRFPPPHAGTGREGARKPRELAHESPTQAGGRVSDSLSLEAHCPKTADQSVPTKTNCPAWGTSTRRVLQRHGLLRLLRGVGKAESSLAFSVLTSGHLPGLGAPSLVHPAVLGTTAPVSCSSRGLCLACGVILNHSDQLTH